jgi:diguanylate cyclase (GGDEF)-like protein
MLIDIDKNILVQALDNLPVGALLIDARSATWSVVYANPVISQLTGGIEFGDLVGRPWSSLLSDPQELAAQQERLLGSPALVVRQLRQRWQSRSGVPVDLDLQVSPLFEGPGQPAFWLATAESPPSTAEEAETETLKGALRDAQVRLRQLDWNDGVTGLLSCRAFSQIVQRDWLIARREQQRLTVIVFHVEAFEKYRELYGKHAADSCIRKISHAITGSLRRAGDAAGRIADDRFGVLVGSAETEKAREFAAQIARKVRELAIHHPRSQVARFITMSFGVGSEIPSRKAASCQLLRRAESELAQPGEASETDREVG